MSRADDNRRRGLTSDVAGAAEEAYRVDWLLGNVPEEPLNYVRKLGSAWAEKLPIDSITLHGSARGSVRVTLHLRSRDAATALAAQASAVLDAARDAGLGSPEYVAATSVKAE